MAFIQLTEVEEKEILPGFKARFVHTEHMTFAYWTITAGAALPEHSHHHEQVATMMEGEFELTIDGTPRIMKPGEVAVIPGNALHSGKAITDCKILDVFYPIREDYKL
ncbi:MAG: cupin domain-containing protein [bacterium]|nr:cupin domain-containing protein [bacterium]